MSLSPLPRLPCLASLTFALLFVPTLWPEVGRGCHVSPIIILPVLCLPRFLDLAGSVSPSELFFRLGGFFMYPPRPLNLLRRLLHLLLLIGLLLLLHVHVRIHRLVHLFTLLHLLLLRLVLILPSQLRLPSLKLGPFGDQPNVDTVSRPRLEVERPSCFPLQHHRSYQFPVIRVQLSPVTAGNQLPNDPELREVRLDPHHAH
mmetsp:Transcript_30883/g.37433  ORF Transcript_30883/g.37433 Transcript_30883/m.37433 type:complete len:202 (+) Transcript_30883:2747-3352(+)